MIWAAVLRWVGGWRRVKTRVLAFGGWSKRKTLDGGDQYARREDSLLDPARDAAKIRAFFVQLQWARRRPFLRVPRNRRTVSPTVRSMVTSSRRCRKRYSVVKFGTLPSPSAWRNLRCSPSRTSASRKVQSS